METTLDYRSRTCRPHIPTQKLHASPGPEAEARATVFRGFSALDDLAQELAKTTVAQEATNQAQELAKTAVAQEATKQAHANVRLRQLELKTLKWKRKHSRSASPPAPAPASPPHHPNYATEDLEDLARQLQHLAEVARSPTTLTDADCAHITSSLRTVEELEDFLDELDLRTRKTVWPHGTDQSGQEER